MRVAAVKSRRSRDNTSRVSPTNTALARLERRLLALHAANSIDRFLRAAQSLLSAAIPHQRITAVRWEAASGLFSTTDLSGRQYPPGFIERFFAANPAVPFVLAHRGIKLVTMSMVMGDEASIRATSFYKEFMEPMGWLHCVGMFFWDKSPRGVECVLNLLRAPGEPDFSQGELVLLRRLYSHLDTAWRRVSRLAQEQAAQRGIESVIRRLPLPIIVLDGELRVMKHNRAAQQACAIWQMGRRRAQNTKATHLASGAPELPPELLAVCSEIQTAWRESVREERVNEGLERSVVHPTIPGLSAILRLGFSHVQQLQEPWLVIEFQDNPALPERADSLTTLAQLSPAEREVALSAAKGESNQAIASRLHRSLNTVKWQMHAVFKKLGIANRTQLVRLLS